MNCSSMDVTIHCDDLVPIDINISDLTRAREVIHQVVSSRRLMTPSIKLDFDDCIISIDDGVRIRLLSRESIVLSALTPKDEQSSHLDLKITASGFRAKAIQSIQSAGQSNYLIEKKTLELRYLLLTSGSNLMSGASSPLRLTSVDANETQDEYLPRSCSSNSSSYSSSHSSNRVVASAPDSPYQTSFSNFLLQKYLTFSTQIKQFLIVEKSLLNGGQRPILDAAEVFLNQRNLPQLFVTASQYDAENFSQSLSATENEVINSVQSVDKVDIERGLANLPGPASNHEAVPPKTAVTHQFATNSESVKSGRAKAKSIVSVAEPPVSATVVGEVAVREVLKGEQSSDDDSSSSSDSDSDSESEESSDDEEVEKVTSAVVSTDVAVAGSTMLPVHSSVIATATLQDESSGSDSDEDSSDEETNIPDAGFASKPLNETNIKKHMGSEAITHDSEVQEIAMQSAALNSGIGTALTIPAVKESIAIEVVVPRKIEIEEDKLVAAESSGSDSDDDSGDETESEVERKPLLASTPVLFESKKKTAKTVEGALVEKVLSGSGSSSDSDSDSDSSDDEVEDNINTGKSDGSTATSLPTPAFKAPVQENAVTDTSNSPKIASKIIESNEEAGCTDGKPKEVTIFESNSVGLQGDDSSSNSDADDVLKITTTVNPIAAMVATDMPFTQDLQFYDIQRDSESASDESVTDGFVDDNDNSTEDAATSTNILPNNNGSRSSKSIAHPDQVDKNKSKSSEEVSVDAAPKVKKNASEDSDSDSSSSSGDDDSDDESSVDYQPAPKKPPLALMHLLFKKPTAKFPSCFLPAQKTKQSDPQKRKSLDNLKNEGTAKKLKKSSSLETDVQKESTAVSSSSSVTASEQGSTSATVEASKADSAVTTSSKGHMDARSSAGSSQANTVTVSEVALNSPALSVQGSSKVQSTPTVASEVEVVVNLVDSSSQSKVKRISKTPSASRTASVLSSSSDNHVAVLSSSSSDRDITATKQSNNVANNNRPTDADQNTPALVATPKKTRAKAIGKSQVASATIEAKSNLKMTPADASKKRKIQSDRIAGMAGIAASPKTPQLEGVLMSKSIPSKRK